jgi:single-strand DNA-binding protein
MNSCILMAEIIKNPEIRSTPDNQMEIANMVVQFSPPLGSRPGERSPTIEVVGWNNVATDMKENYKQGDRVTIEGRLQMNTIERDGYKEKRAQLIASHIYHMSAVDMPAAAPTATAAASSSSSPSRSAATPAPRAEERPTFDAEDGDNIPF